jgi:hypothetical protein
VIRTLSLVSGLGRVALGASMLAAPRWMLGAQGFRELTPAALAVTRLAGIRDMVMGAQMLESLDDEEQLRRAHLWCAVTDAGDATVFAALLTRGDDDRAALAGLAAAVPATLIGFWAARKLGN